MYCRCTMWRPYFTFVYCLQHLEIFSETSVMSGELIFVVSRALLIFHERFPDVVSIAMNENKKTKTKLTAKTNYVARAGLGEIG